jgi:hypothetical protein
LTQIYIQWPIDSKEACPRGVRSELWLTEEEYRYISDVLRESGFAVEKIEETPRKSSAVSVSQVSVRSSNRSGGRQRSSVPSTRVHAVSGISSKDSISEAERNEYRRLVQLLIRTHKTASQPFLFPVPDTVPGYYDIIKKPSDLTTIRQRLDSSSYLNRSEFERDFLQMIWNAYIFNPPHSEVFRAAMELHAAFVEGLQKAVIALNDLKRADAYAEIESARKMRKAKRQSEAALARGASVGGRSSSSGGASLLNRKSSTEEELRKKLEYLQKVVSKQSAVINQRSTTPSPPIDNSKPLTERQLDQLASDLEQLEPKYVPQVANILRGEPTAKIADGHLDLSIHDLPPARQRELMKLMEKIKAQEALRDRLNERVRAYGSEESDYDSLVAKRHRV